jgi:chromosomal replication initiation ATPase DnaA
MNLQVLYLSTKEVGYTFGIDYKLYEAPLGFSLSTIARMICHSENITEQQLKGGHRNKNIVWARKIFCWLAYSQSDKSTTQVGLFLGGRDHSTIIYCIRQVERALASDPSMKTKLARYMNMLKRQ